MKNHHTNHPMIARDKFIAWLHLTRFDKPVGTELLLYPTLWAVLMAYVGQEQMVSLKVFVIFTLGAILMRAAGCAINDFADRKVDGHVKRTNTRPLADGRLSAKTALYTFVGLSLLSACLLFFLPVAVFYWSLGAVVLAFVYPFMKRYTHLPQVVLAAAFGWAIPMAFVAAQGHTDVWTWVLFVAYMCWTVAYDTQYAMCDRDDDMIIGVKSTAILFGKYDVAIIVLLKALFVGLMAVALVHYYGDTLDAVWICVALLPVVGKFIYQYNLIKDRERLACFAAFRHNVWVGRYMFALVAVLTALPMLLA
ncbi:4-hydroxybenzoate octaprenyltransferase [Moraxella sp. FZLJ2107]|uniref:4-hydroxybenzoate octaprenyltransferase n=1 Tax=unclassified Moraxella TaxID=2685852 RepID=UPI0020C89E9C|nr:MULTISPECIES: 4-hydroxybenzoate octaprenyltransferase [unclassified Moraxella]UTO05782.1 4-hydroxybenzoate octaprenyltransferase [Moraxella sp. FZLJ2107]UTO22518.1 4-hydroxybenzoate octaprenyltransferase [Moraxella sp. FZLJ2109]